VFSGLPQTFRDLILVVDATSTSTRGLQIRVNGDASGSYSYVYANGDGSSATSAAASGQTSFTQGAVATSRTNNIFQFMDYSATDKQKTLLSRFNGASLSTQMAAERWANTAAINSITLFVTVNPFAVGSTFTIFGVIA
jgi:hypothetical protein